MKKNLSLFFVFGLFAINTGFARQVDIDLARSVAKNFIATQSGISPEMLLLDAASFETAVGTITHAYYIFALGERKGFVVVAADDNVKPVLAYSLSNNFLVGEKASPENKYWMNLYKEQIAYIVNNNIKADEDIVSQWRLWSGNDLPVMSRPANTSEPLLTTTWNQGTYYNLYTPGSGRDKTPVGCVATAMAQIMKYWNYPSTGAGSYSYSSQYGTLSADFGTTEYNWGAMPDALSATSFTYSKEAVALLGYHCAISVQMNFAPSGSGSQVIAWRPGAISAETAFPKHFGYKSSIKGMSRKDYPDTDWLSLLKNEIDNARPILYAGYGNSGGQTLGHAFIFDAYDANNMFHVNWGWGGLADGFYTINNLQPQDIGIGGGAGRFNDNQQALIQIEPSGEAQPVKALALTVGDHMNISSTKINKGESFTITALIQNSSELDYTGGYYRAEAYKEDSTFVTSSSPLRNQNLLVDSSMVATFSSGGFSNLEPGKYFIKIAYMDINSEWTLLKEDEGFRNRVDFEILGDGSTGINNTIEDEHEVLTYPNPVSDVLIVDVTGFSGKVNSVKLYNLNGQELVSRQPGNNEKLSIPVQQLATGIYYIRIATDNGFINRKVAVKH